MVRHIFNVKTMVVKFFSCVCAVGAGLPIGPEGPMIHLGYVLLFLCYCVDHFIVIGFVNWDVVSVFGVVFLLSR